MVLRDPNDKPIDTLRIRFLFLPTVLELLGIDLIPGTQVLGTVPREIPFPDSVLFTSKHLALWRMEEKIVRERETKRRERRDIGERVSVSECGVGERGSESEGEKEGSVLPIFLPEASRTNLPSITKKERKV
jgi:hypothetical protein